MTGGTPVIAFGKAEEHEQGHPAAAEQAAPAAKQADLELAEEHIWIGEEQELAPSGDRFIWILRGIGLLAIAGWTGFFAWAHRQDWLGGLSADAATRLLVDWSVPVLLVAVVWLLAMRSSTRETRRFGDAASLLAAESTRLEERLHAVNRELSLARDFIASQTRDLDSVGRVAVERISGNAERLQALIVDNDDRVNRLGEVSAVALDNMVKLREQLPVITTSTRDMTNHIGNAGRTAQAQIEEMVRGFKRMNEFGQASEVHVASVRTAVGDTLAALERQCSALEKFCNDRLAAIDANARQAAAELDEREARERGLIEQRNARLIADAAAQLQAITDETARIEQAFADRTQKFAEEVASRQETQQQGEAQALERMAALFADLDAQIAARLAEHGEKAEALAQTSSSVAARVSEATSQIEAIAARSQQTEALVGESLESVAARVIQAHAGLEQTRQGLAALTDDSIRLLEIIQAGSEHSRQKLPLALSEAEGRLDDFNARIATLLASVGKAVTEGDTLFARIDATDVTMRTLIAQIEDRQRLLERQGSTQTETFASLAGILEELEAKTETVAKRVDGELTTAIARLQISAREAVESIETSSAAKINALAQRLGDASAEAIETAVKKRAAEATIQLEKAAADAAGVGRDATIQLRDQLAKVAELVANLEQRVSHARERAEERVDNDFARRVALITESLNSNAIDIAKALSTDVSDTAWEEYLRGDRGIFTRRAVSLIQASEARAIHQIFERDNDFREHVSRYIHDFEAILREVLSTRDGNAIGVTLLSSDMGKLYVVLAQAIERLRN